MEPKHSILVFVVVLLVLFTGVYFLYHQGGLSIPKTTPNFDQIKSALLQGAKIHFPQARSVNVVTDDDLPLQITELLLPDRHSNLYQRIQYVNGKTGYAISFTMSLPLIASYQQMRSVLANAGVNHSIGKGTPDWKVSYGIRANLFGVTNASSSRYDLAVYQAFIDRNKTAVKIQIIAR